MQTYPETYAAMIKARAEAVDMGKRITRLLDAGHKTRAENMARTWRPMKRKAESIAALYADMAAFSRQPHPQPPSGISFQPIMKRKAFDALSAQEKNDFVLKRGGRVVD